MVTENYTTRTAALKAAVIDTRILDARQITLKGQDILEYIGNSDSGGITTVKHCKDTREVITENDLWGQWIETLEDGTVIIHDDEIINPNKDNSDISLRGWNKDITKVEDNKAYVGASFYGNIQLEKMKNAHSSFCYCGQLASFNGNLSSLTNGDNMFDGCINLTTFNSALPSLTNGNWMFAYCYKLRTFDLDISSLTDGTGMFRNCTNLTTFTSNLSSLANGRHMFCESINLTTFTSDLSSLTNGYEMFHKTKLTPRSIMFIAELIKDIVAEKKLYQNGTIPYVTLSNNVYSSTKGFMSDGSYVYTYNNTQPYTTTISASNVGQLTIGINVTNDAATIADQLQAFAEGAYYDSWADLKQKFIDKGWTVTWQYGGTTTSITYDMRGERTIPCAVYTKLVEVEDKDQAEYTNEEGTKFYNIEWGHDVTHPQDFQQFDSIEDAMVAYGVILNVTETEE